MKQAFANLVARRDELTRCVVFLALIVVAVSVRLVSDVPNFNAVTAASLFAGFFFRSRMTAFAVPLLAMAVSNVLLGGYSLIVMLAVYFAFCLPVLCRSFLRRWPSPLMIGGGAVVSSLLFFLITNFAVWCVAYPPTWAGLVRCYTLALPFLANSLLSDLLFSGVFFGLYAVVMQVSRVTSPRLAADAT